MPLYNDWMSKSRRKKAREAHRAQKSAISQSPADPAATNTDTGISRLETRMDAIERAIAKDEGGGAGKWPKPLIVSIVALVASFLSGLSSFRTAQLKGREQAIQLETTFSTTTEPDKNGQTGSVLCVRLSNRGAALTIERVTLTEKQRPDAATAAKQRKEAYDLALDTFAPELQVPFDRHLARVRAEMESRRSILIDLEIGQSELPKTLAPLTDGMTLRCVTTGFEPKTLTILTTGGESRTFVVPPEPSSDDEPLATPASAAR